MTQRAEALLRAVDEGGAVGAAIDALVGAVLGAETVRLALAVREGGPLRVRRAIELASALLEGSAAAAGERRGVGT